MKNNLAKGNLFFEKTIVYREKIHVYLKFFLILVNLCFFGVNNIKFDSYEV